jgi:hypothetical protein
MKKDSNNIICMKHRHYNAETKPDLTCKACCAIFIQNIRETQKDKSNARKAKASNAKE